MDFAYLLFAIFVLLSIYFYLTRNYVYWKIQNIPSAPWVIPGFGHILPLLLLQDNLGTLLEKLYQKMGNSSMYGCYLMQRPALLIRDPELIKIVLQRNFSSFQNNLFSVHDSLDPIMSKNPFFAKDEVWRETRNQLANNFSGKKIRFLFGHVVQVCEKFVDFIDHKIDVQSFDAEFELKDLNSRIVGEIVANYIFGIEGQSFEDTPDYKSFASVVKRFFDATPINGIRQAVRFFLPSFADCIGVSFLPKETDTFIRNHFKTFIKSVLCSKEVERNFFQFPIEEIHNVDENMMIARATTILFDGYETSNTVLSFLIYRLAENTLIQDKAREEVNLIFEQFNGKLTYEAVKNMDYLDQVIYETLRMNPVFVDFARVCNEEITLQGFDNLTCHLRPGDVVLISPGSSHMDEDFWPNPSVFDPERFSVANKTVSNRYTYLAFGEGPRICPGRRMGIMIVKAIAAVILQRYLLETSVKSKGPLKKNPHASASVIKGGLWVRFKRLSSKH